MAELLRMEGITKQFGAVYANKDINLSIEEGEIHTLLGENGAGKSTLMNILIGLYQPTSGTIWLKGKKVKIDSPKTAVKLGIGMVHQHFMLVDAMTVFENIILGTKKDSSIFIKKEERKKEILELSQKYGLEVDLDKQVNEISVGEQQRVEILKALYRGAELLILDEPTAALTDQEVEGLFSIMGRLTAENKSVIFISHKMREVMAVSDRVTILRAGQTITTVDKKDTDGAQLANLMIGHEMTVSAYKKVTEPGEDVLRLLHVDYQKDHKHSGLNNVSFSIGKGEILGVAGVDGNGAAGSNCRTSAGRVRNDCLYGTGWHKRNVNWKRSVEDCGDGCFPFVCSGRPSRYGSGRKYDSRRKSGFKGHGRTSFFLCTRRFIKEKSDPEVCPGTSEKE
mgnify:CR=1 FL=1